MAYTPPLTMCSTCGGDGLDGVNVCLTCFGSGATPVMDKNALLFSSILSKLDAVIAEQASIRDDLTTAIAAIWNKVKNL